MAYQLEDSFWFPRELGARLAELRRKRGLTQQQLAVLMGRQGKCGKSLVCRLERGRFKTPSLRLVGDYLRACGAGFRDLLDILERYTARPGVVDRQGLAEVQKLVAVLPAPVAGEVRKLDVKTAVARRFEGKLPEPVEKRVRRSRKLAARRLWLARLHSYVVGVLSLKPRGIGLENETILQKHCRKMWGILGRTRGTPERRAKELDELEAKLVASGRMEVELIREIQRAVADLFERAVKQGFPDRFPGA
jgi:transcriptional regulator with XRE-family HTH domain